MKAEAIPSQTLNDGLVERWKKDSAIRGMSSETIRGYSYEIQAFARFLQGCDLLEVDKIKIKAYLEDQRSRGITTQTIRLRLAALSSFYEFCIFEELIDANPVIEIRRRYLSRYKIDGEKHTHKLISVEEAATLINSLVDIRDKAIVTLLFKTGIRRRELLALDINDINWQDQSILLKPTKKRTNRTVFFDGETALILQRWLNVRQDRNRRGSPALFISSWGKRLDRGSIHYIIRKPAVLLGLHNENSDMMEDHFSAHCCRHWFTTHLRRAGMPREFIQELRGDVRREAIDIYDHIDKKELRESYLAHIPQLGI